MNFKTYYLSESVQSQDIYKFYALSFILFGGNNVRVKFDDGVLNMIEKEYENMRTKLWSDLCADLIRGMIEQIPHIYTQRAFYPSDLDRDQFEKFVSGCKEVWLDLGGLMVPEVSLTEVENAIKSVLGKSVEYVLSFINTVFEQSDSHIENTWENVSGEILDFYSVGPNKMKVEDIDHMLDLVHVNGKMIEKLPNKSTVKRALDIKRKAKTPREYAHEIKGDSRIDRLIPKWIGRATMGENL